MRSRLWRSPALSPLSAPTSGTGLDKFWGQVVLRWVLKDGQDCSRRGQAYGGRGISKGAAVGS